ncbi:glycosyltransferase [Haloarculaceae archaeon H-GB2-1]|nr:glycosyltransferase [Haloarculaceae archaeon H-GB2-1]
MYAGLTVGVVIPAYNEVAHIGDVIESLPHSSIRSMPSTTARRTGRGT